MSCSGYEATKLIADLWAALEDAGVAETGTLAATDPKLYKDADADRGRAMIRAWLKPQTGGTQ
jgi:hypothetical protein